MAKEKKSGGQWIGVLLYMLIGALCGVLFLQYMNHGGTALGVALLFVCMYAVLVVQIVIHEAGHLVFGLLTGYRFISFRVFSFMWMKEKGRIRFRRMSLAGTGGQCLMAPPDMKEGQFPFMLYNFGGAILNMASALICLGLGALCARWSTPWVILMIFAVIGFFYALMNGLPFRMGVVNNDGRNALDISRSEEARRAFWVRMKVNELLARGVRIRDMPEALFSVPSDEEMQNGIVSSLGVLSASRLMDQHLFKEADDLMARLLAQKNGIVGLHRALMTDDRVYMELIGDNRPDVLRGMLTEEQKKVMKAMKNYPSVLRTAYARALLADKDAAEAENIRNQFDKVAKSYPYPCDIASERELMDIALEAARSED